MSDLIPIGWIAQILNVSPAKARRQFNAQGGAIPLESFIEWVERKYKNIDHDDDKAQAKYKYYLKQIEILEGRILKDG